MEASANAALFCSVLAFAPALGVWLAWPRRRWAAWGAAAAAVALWAVWFVLFQRRSAGSFWVFAGALSLPGCFYACYGAGRDEAEYSRLEALLRERRGRKAGLSRRVEEARSSGARAEGEQKEVQALYGMVKGLSEALSWEEARPKLESAVRQYLGVEEFALYVADLRVENALHPLVARRLGASVGAGWDTLSRCLQERGISLSAPSLLESPESAIAAPIRDASELMGYFYARVPQGADARALLLKAASFTEEIAFAFRRVKLFQELERLSRVDGLTGVFRRGVLDQRLKEEVVRARTFKTGFCMMLLDIDHFKRLNDSYGHPFGDQVLQRVGALLKAGVYETDFVARYGGEEFALLLPRADPAGVLRKAEALRAAVEAEAFPLAMETVRVTVSIGVAHYPRDGSSPEAITYQADQALYQAKERGRNRVVDIGLRNEIT